MPGFHGQEGRVHADVAQGSRVFLLLRWSKNQIGPGRRMQPDVCLQLALELPRCPTGVAQRQNGPIRPLAARNRLENFDRDGQADLV